MSPSRLLPRVPVCLLALACLAAGAAAQAPLITAAGDPSISSEELYGLAVAPADYPDDALVYLLNDAVVRLDADGRGTRTFRQVVQVLKEQAVSGLGERRIVYSPDHQTFTLNWARVVRPDGSVISPEPAQLQEADVAAPVRTPVYVNRKEVRMSFGGVAVGTIIDMSYTIEEAQPYLAGDHYTHWNVTGPTPVRRSRFIFDVPSGVEPILTERNLDVVAESAAASGRRSYAWERADVPGYRPEPFAPDTNAVRMFVVASLPMSWAEIASWYGALARDRYPLTRGIEAKIGELVAGARTRTDTIRAVHRWVAQDIRYVSVSLGLGGYQPRPPEETVATGFGDCKDKTTLFIAALRHLGIEANPVLLNLSGSLVRKEHPSIRQFNHVIAAVGSGDDLVFTDLTAAYTPYGDLPLQPQGGFAVVVLPEGGGKEVLLPRDPVGSRSIEYEIVATISESGEMSGYMEEMDSGPGFEARRSLFAVPLDSARRETVMRGLLGIIPGARGDSIHGFDGRDLYAPVRYKLFFSGARGTARTGGAELFTFPFTPLPATSRIASIESFGPRRTSIEARAVLRSPPATLVVDMRVTLPEGWRARLPEDVVVQSDFGSYSTEYSQEGRVLRIVRRESPGDGIHPPERLPDVLDFFRAISADEHNRTIIIESGGRLAGELRGHHSGVGAGLVRTAKAAARAASEAPHCVIGLGGG